MDIHYVDTASQTVGYARVGGTWFNHGVKRHEDSDVALDMARVAISDWFTDLESNPEKVERLKNRGFGKKTVDD